jgi:hypothetical protein
VGRIAVAAAVAATIVVPGTVRACHGPGTAAGGVQVWSARPLARGSFAVLLRADYTRFEALSPADIDDLTRSVSGDHAHLHVVDRSMLSTLGLLYGLTDQLEIGVLFAYYAASGVGEGHAHGGASYAFSDYGDIDGPADTWVSARLRVHSSPGGDVALIGGLKAPTGDDHVVVDGVAVDQALQPGSGSWDASLAVAFTRDLGERFVMDASAQYVFRTEANDYRIGDQSNLGLALAVRIAGDVHADRWLWGFFESSVRVQAENEEDGEPHVNSGGTTVFLTPGLRGDLPGGVSASLGLQLPVVEELNDVQQGIDYKLTGSLSVSF